MNLLMGDESQQLGNNAPNYAPNWQYPQYPSPQPLLNPQQYQPYYYGPYYPPPKNASNFTYGAMPPYPPPQQHPTLLSTPPPQPNNNPSNNDDGGNAPKWSLVEDRRLVKSWINVSTNPLTGADQKKSGFWTKVTYIFNQNAPNGAVKNHRRCSTLIETRQLP